MLRKLKVPAFVLPAFALIFTLSNPVVHADASSNDFDKLMDLSGVTNSIEAMSQMVSSEMGQAQLEAQIGDAQLAAVISRSLQSSLTPALFEQSITGALRERLTQQEISLFLAAFIGGGALSQYPVGWLADAFDRRWVLIALSVGAIVSALILLMSQTWGVGPLVICSALFGFITMPMFSVSASHANDFTNDEERVELAAALMFFYALGAIASPLLGSKLIDIFGPSSLFVLLSVGHLLLIVFGLWRMRSRAARTIRTPYVYTPRSSFTIGRLLRRRRDR